MSKTVLITSFATWKNSQPVNSSDQLLGEVLQSQPLPSSVYFLRQLPVNTPVAQDMAIAQITQLQPQTVLCCGMAETRVRLSLEAQAVVGQQVLQTSVDLPKLMKDLSHSEISQDAGRFVCNSFYYFVMDYLRRHYPPGTAGNSSPNCLFIHVPILTNRNRSQILMDFSKILHKCVF
jgi:pyroglutamyl-peptidase